MSYGEKETRRLLKGVKMVYAARGRKVVTVDLKQERFTKEMIEKLLLGPTGNLRAPAFRFGANLLVGFSEELYCQLFDL